MCILEHMASTFYLPFLLHLLLPLYHRATVCYYLPYYPFMLPLYCVCIECARSFFSLCKSSRHLLSLIWLSLQHVGLTLMFLITYHILTSIFASITSASYDVTLLTISFALAHLCCHRSASSPKSGRGAASHRCRGGTVVRRDPSPARVGVSKAARARAKRH